jgi:plastocyanin
MSRFSFAFLLIAACGSSQKTVTPVPVAAPVSAAPVSAPATTPAPPAPPTPVGERVEALREATSLLEKADAARLRGAKSFAEQLFSSAEVITGPEAVAQLAPLFREGAPPRVTAPVVVVPKDAAPQPVAVGDSEKDTPPPKPAPTRANVTGTVKIAGVAGLGVVTLEPVGRKWTTPPPVTKTVEQRNRQFAPQVLVVPVGSTVSFPNFDAIFHNVFSTSEAKSFDLGLYKNGEARSVVLDREGVLRIGCNLHANMAAHVVVVKQPHYAVTGGDGAFRFTSLQPGKYILRAWSDRSVQPVTQEVDLKAGANQVNVGVPNDAPKGPLPDKFGVPRG